MITPSYPSKFPIPENFWKTESPLRNFSVLWENHFSTKSWCSILCNFCNPEFFWNKRVHRRVFSVLRDKRVSRENRDIPFLSIKFSIKEVSEKWRLPLWTFSVLWENQFPTKSWYTILCNFFIPQFFWNTRIHLRKFPALWDKKISTVINDNPLLSFKISDTRSFLKDRESTTKSFGTVRKTTCDKIVIDQLMQFFYSRIILKQKSPPTNFFGTERQKSFERMSWYPTSYP